MEKVLKEKATLKHYLLLTKPGIIMGNSLTAIGGFALAAKGFSLPLFAAMLEGLILIIGAACVFNNIIDRETDTKMDRTKNRPLARRLISIQNAAFMGVLLALLGTVILILGTSLLTTVLALLGLFFYVFVYSFLKYQTSYGTLIGSIAGAIPPVVGYTAASSTFDLGALILFVIIAMWQMPHFYAIAIYRQDDYAKASIPVFPQIKGMKKAKIHMVGYLLAFIGANAFLTLSGYTNSLFAVIMSLVGLLWLALSLQGFKAKNDQTWARKMFIFSLIVVMTLSIALPFTTACG